MNGLAPRLKVVSSVLMALCLTGVGCANQGSFDEQSGKTVTIRGDGVSVQLPSYFVGGDPGDPGVAGALTEIAQ